MNLKLPNLTIILTLFSLIFVVISFMIHPPEEYDLYRHYERMEMLRELDFHQIVIFSKPGYKFFDVYTWLIQNVHLPNQFLPASIVFISYMLVFSIFKDIRLTWLKECNLTTKFLCFMALWLAINFVGLASGIRSNFAIVIIFYFSYYLFFKSKYISFVVASIFAFFVHPFSIVLSFATLSSKLFSHFSGKGKVLIFIGILFALLTPLTLWLINSIVNIFDGFDFFKGTYFQEETKWGAGYSSTRNINGLIGDYLLSRLSIYIAFIYLIFNSPKRNDAIYLLLCMMMSYILIFFFYRTLYGRMSVYFILIFSIYIIMEYIKKKDRLNGYFLIAYVASMLLASTYNIYIYDELLLSIF